MKNSVQDSISPVDRKAPENAIIYARVSDKKQIDQGHGLVSQQTICKEHAERSGYNIVATFTDTIKGAKVTRTGMDALVKFINSQRDEAFVVVFDHLNRLARDLEVYLYLSRVITDAGSRMETPTLRFENTAASRAHTNMLAVISQYESDENRERVIRRMRARLLNGYYPFPLPKGYYYEQVKGQGALVRRDEPIASIIAEALEGYATGRFASQAEVVRFLQGQPAFPKPPSGSVPKQLVSEMLDCLLYTGYYEYPAWDVPLTKGIHEPLISYDTFKKIQARKQKPVTAPIRKDLNEDFPLRGFVVCADCGTPYRGSWSKGRSAYHAYYCCQTKGCAAYGKSIRRDDMEGDFEELLKGMTPHESVFAAFRDILKDVCEHRGKQDKQSQKALSKELGVIETQSAKLMDRILNTDNDALIEGYEAKLGTLAHRKTELEEKMKQKPAPRVSFQDTYRTAMEFLSNPLNYWHSERFSDKRMVLKLAFSERLAYRRGEGYRTAETTNPFKALASFFTCESRMVGPEGLEPPT